jgi:hypothetical protein
MVQFVTVFQKDVVADDHGIFQLIENAGVGE